MDPADTIQANAGRPFAFLLLKTHPDSGRFTYQIRFRHKAPVTAVRGIIAVITHHEVVSRWYDPTGQLLARLPVVHPHLILRDWHGEDTVGHITQRLFTFNQANTVLFGLAFGHWKKPLVASPPLRRAKVCTKSLGSTFE